MWHLSDIKYKEGAEFLKHDTQMFKCVFHVTKEATFINEKGYFTKKCENTEDRSLEMKGK